MIYFLLCKVEMQREIEKQKEEEKEKIEKIEKISNTLDSFYSNNSKDNTSKYLTLHNLLSLSKTRCLTTMEAQYTASKLVAKSFFTDVYLNSCNENLLFVFTLLRDKCYQIFLDYKRDYELKYKMICDFLNNGDR